MEVITVIVPALMVAVFYILPLLWCSMNLTEDYLKYRNNAYVKKSIYVLFIGYALAFLPLINICVLSWLEKEKP